MFLSSINPNDILIFKMQSLETPSNTPNSTNHSRNANFSCRFLSSRKLEYVPGFDLGTPHKNQSCENCFIFKSIKTQESSLLAPGYESSPLKIQNSGQTRVFPTQADKILDAPEIVEDYYLNLLSWSDSNILAVALRGKLYLWSGQDGSVEVLKDSRNEIITSVSWMKGGKCLAVGDSSHNIHLLDIEKKSEIRKISSHSDRVSSLAWNGLVLSSGSRDSSIVNHDLRIKDYFVKYSSHSQEVCGLRWNPEGTILASGANDNKVCLWDLASTQPLLEFKEHKAAVKALAWCPWKTNLLASGGGSLDRTIKLWDCSTGACLLSRDTGSQVSALEWNRFDKEVVSAHGYNKNQISLWKAKGLEPVTEFYGHSARILNMCLSPDYSTVVTAGADETLRFWKLFCESDKDASESPGNKMAPRCR
jgi:cell division cycle protein 20 (cofactor of APC complex)